MFTVSKELGEKEENLTKEKSEKEALEQLRKELERGTILEFCC